MIKRAYILFLGTDMKGGLQFWPAVVHFSLTDSLDQRKVSASAASHCMQHPFPVAMIGAPKSGLKSAQECSRGSCLSDPQ